MIPSTIIHVGYGRTATTYLQNKIFPNIEGIKYLGKTNQYYPDWLIDLNYLDDIQFYKKIRDIKLNIQSDKQTLISSEAFTQTGGIYRQMERVKSVVEHAKIIIVIRRPVDLIVSKYRYLVEKGYLKGGLSSNIDFSSRPYDLVRRPKIYLEDYNYPLIISHIRSIFGDLNVLVLKYESLVSDRDDFLDLILNFTGGSLLKDCISHDSVNASSSSYGQISSSTIGSIENHFSLMFDYDSIFF